MSHTAEHIAVARPTTYTAPSTPEERAALTAECIAAILAGRPFPEAVRVPEARVSAPATVQEGIARILSGTPSVVWR